jgi:phosphoribosylformylglycinamidine (FGAM) synthase-like enzyme
VHGVVEGIGGYGNCFGVPTVGGEVGFTRPITAIAWSTPSPPGWCQADKIFYSPPPGVGMPVVYLGAKTGRDGVGGATMASAEFDDTIEEKRPTVQVGDPFTEKRLLEACLELMADRRRDLDPGHGRGGPDLLGGRDGRQGRPRHRLDLDHVPQREDRMTPTR